MGVAGDGIACLSFLTEVLDLKGQLGYVVYFGEKVTALEKEKTSLIECSGDLEREVKYAERDPTRQRTGEIEDWQRRVDAIRTEVDAIRQKFELLQNQGCKFFGRCSGNIFSRYKIGSKAAELLAEVKELMSIRGSIGRSVSLPLPPPAGRLLSISPSLEEMERINEVKRNIDNVLGHMTNPGVRFVGIYGMGGVGKTLLLKAINNKLLQLIGARDDFYDYVMLLEVPNAGPDLHKLKLQVVDCLGLQLAENANLELHIYNFLMDKRFVVLLDNLWEPLDLNAIGITPNQNSKVVFTTRSDGVCGRMRAQKVKVECLNEANAWSLFQENVGNDEIISRPDILPLAKEIAKECKGLPLALNVIGKAMSSKITPNEWNHALTSLKNSQLVTKFLDSKTECVQLLKLLRVSYDLLPDDVTRQCFLLCALFPEGQFIHIDTLIQCCLGHGLVADRQDNDIGQAYDSWHALIGILRSASLLETDDKNECVKMHDILRDMALWIAREDGECYTKWVVRAGLRSTDPLGGVKGWESSERVSVMNNEISALPEPKKESRTLSTFILRGNPKLEEIPTNFFKYFPSLTYLDLSGTKIRILPKSLSKLRNLRYLNLAGTEIEYLIIDMKSLETLRHLILRDCRSLKYIPYGLIGNLLKLRVLDIFGCEFIFTKDDKVESQENNDPSVEPISTTVPSGGIYSVVGDGETRSEKERKTNIDELKFLKGKLECLGLTLDMKTIPYLQSFVDNRTIRQLKVVGLKESKVHDIIRRLMEIGKVIELLELEKLSNIEELNLSNDNQNLSFGRLKSLSFTELNKLATITWNRESLVQMFPNLTTVGIHSCHGLKDLTWTGHLRFLKYFRVDECQGLEEIIRDESNDDGRPPSIFPKIREVHLENLPKLVSICNPTIKISLKRFRVVKCPKLRGSIPFIMEAGETNTNLELDIVSNLHLELQKSQHM